MIKISLDIDGCLANFEYSYYHKFGKPKSDLEITKNVHDKLMKDKDFWMNLPVIERPNFTPRQYTTARLISKNWIKEYLTNNKFPKAPIYQVLGYSLSKVPKLRMGGCDVHVDDSISTFIRTNLEGIPCLLLDRPNNQKWGAVGRIYSLDKDEIEESYNLFIKTMYPYFKEIVNEFRSN